MRYLFFAFAAILLISIGCSQTNTTTAVQSDDTASCAPGEVILDPNQAKPMALMMRQMAATADSIRQKIIKGEKPDSVYFPFVRFYLVEPTDKSVLEPQFYENARGFQRAYYKVFEEGADKHTFNAMITSCMGCHQQYCSGPMKRIRKLYIP